LPFEKPETRGGSTGKFPESRSTRTRNSWGTLRPPARGNPTEKRNKGDPRKPADNTAASKWLPQCPYAQWCRQTTTYAFFSPGHRKQIFTKVSRLTKYRSSFEGHAKFALALARADCCPDRPSRFPISVALIATPEETPQLDGGPTKRGGVAMPVAT